MKICINKNHLDVYATGHNKIEDLIKLYQIIEIDDQYEDCIHSDFELVDNTYVFNIDKYNKRKQKLDLEDAIYNLKNKLSSTDYQAIKFAEGHITEEEYQPTKQQRALWRTQINELEEQIKNL